MHFEEYAKVTGMYFFFTFSLAIISPILAPYLKSLGISNVNLSILFSVLPLSIILTSPLIGRVSDKIGRNIIIFFSIAAEIIALILYSFAHAFPIIVLARILDAVAAASISILAIAKIQDSVEKKRGRFAGISLSIQQIGNIIGPVAGGFIADHIFVKAPFYAAIIILFFLLFFAQNKNKEKSKFSKITRKDFSWVKEIREFLSVRELRGMAVLGFAMHASIPATTVFLPILIVEKMALNYSYVGFAFFALNAPLLLQFYFGKLADAKAYRFVILGTMLYGIFIAALIFNFSFFMIALMLFLCGIGGSMWNISAWTLMSNIGEKIKREGGVIGSYMAIAKIGSFVSFLISGFIVQFYGIRTLFLINGILIILGVILAYPLIKNDIPKENYINHIN